MGVDLHVSSDVFEPPGTPPDRAIKHGIDLLPDSVPPANSKYRILPVGLAEVRKQLDEYLIKSRIRPRNSVYGASIFFARKKDGILRICIYYRSLKQ